MKTFLLIMLLTLCINVSADSNTISDTVMTGNPDGSTLVLGNIGMGVTTPTNKMDVNGTVKATAFIGDGSQLTGSSITNVTSSGSNIGVSSINPGSTLDVGGTIRYAGSLVSTGTSMGVKVKTATNQACNTTCGTGCFGGFNTGTLGIALAHITTCTDATADECFCLGIT